MISLDVPDRSDVGGQQNLGSFSWQLPESEENPNIAKSVADSRNFHPMVCFLSEPESILRKVHTEAKLFFFILYQWQTLGFNMKERGGKMGEILF